jgi:hypothetical protein
MGWWPEDVPMQNLALTFHNVPRLLDSVHPDITAALQQLHVHDLLLCCSSVALCLLAAQARSDRTTPDRDRPLGDRPNAS